ncbi:hypothetical protein MW887_011236 [Aspergillus wentii]|nr:hypothetical protein MW887_011236 [Aspergillus wentii]
MAQQPMYRRSDCSHSTIVRQYCRSQLDVCDICRGHPFLGWLYQCTEDTGGYAAPIDAENGSFLSPWLSNAIEQGHYTKEQTKTIIQQKIDVLNTAEATNPPSSSLPGAEGDSGIYDNNHNDDDDDEEVWAETVEKVNQLDPSSTSRSEGKRPAARVSEPGPSSSVPPPRPRPLPCKFRCCYRCRPNFFERTWLSFNDIKDMEPPTIADLMDRPINDARVVRNLGLRRSPSPCASFGPGEQTLGTPSLYRHQNTTGANLPELLNAQAETHTSAETEQDTSQTHSAENEQEIIIGLDSGLTTAVGDTSVGDNVPAEADDGN